MYIFEEVVCTLYIVHVVISTKRVQQHCVHGISTNQGHVIHPPTMPFLQIMNCSNIIQNPDNITSGEIGYLYIQNSADNTCTYLKSNRHMIVYTCSNIHVHVLYMHLHGHL